MNEKLIPRGATPTIRYNFKVVDVTNIAVAYMTIKQGRTTIEKTLTDATVVHTETENHLDWTLSQAETLSICDGLNLEIQCRWKLDDGTAGESYVSNVPPYRILKEGEI